MRAVTVLVAVLLGSCGRGAGSHVCSEIGCDDQLAVTLHDANGSLPDGDYTLSVTVGGVTTTCAFTLPLVPVRGGGTPGIDCPAPTIRVDVLQPMTCVTSQDGGVASVSCAPMDGKLDARLVVVGSPASVRLVATIDGARAFDDTLTPTYATTQPNGPGCAPTCRQAEATVTIGRP